MNISFSRSSGQGHVHEAPLIDRLFIGAGAMKAGTTWLYQVLDQHPDIFFSLEKEIHYFYAVHVNRNVLSEDVRLRNVRDKYLRIDPSTSRSEAVRKRLHWASNYLSSPIDDFWYRNLFVFRQGQRFASDFSNLYALLPSRAWAQIERCVGELKVLYTMRDPRKRLWSHVKFHLEITGQGHVLDVWGRDEFRDFLRKPFIWENAEYGKAIRSMRAGLSEDTLMIAFHEDIHADERLFLRQVEDFLDIPAHVYPEKVLNRKVNASTVRPMPEFFAGLVEKDVGRILDELGSEGITPPDCWMD